MRIFAFADEASPSISGQIRAMVRNHLDGLEIRGVDGENISKISPKKAREVRLQLEDAGLICWSVGSPLGKVPLEEDFAPHYDLFCRTLELAHVLGAENIRLFSFYPEEGPAPAAARDLVLARLERFLEAARGSGITLCHENEKGIYGDTAQRCLEIHQALPEIKAVFDPANFIQCGQNTLEAWELLQPHVRYMHIKDALADGQVVPPGRGIGNLPQLLERFAGIGGENITVEPHLAVFQGLQGLDRTGDVSTVGRYVYPSNDAAFDTACAALKAIL